MRETHDATHERRRHLAALADGVTVHHTGMGFGGTSWGWLPGPGVYTSYDYGAVLDEDGSPRRTWPPPSSSAISCAPCSTWPGWSRTGTGRNAPRTAG
ncbi:beta-galactosidase [Streptomyces thermocarboxydus]